MQPPGGNRAASGQRSGSNAKFTAPRRAGGNDPARDFRAAVLAALGFAPDAAALEPGRLVRFATRDRRGNFDGWARLFADGRGGSYGCWRSGLTAHWQADRAQPLTRAERQELARQITQARAAAERAQSAEWAAAAARNALLWAQAVPLTPGDPVSRYLVARGLEPLLPTPAALRFHPRLAYRDDDGEVSRHPAMVAALTAPSGAMVALHRTYLSREGTKADVATPRKLTPPSGPLTGACIALAAPRRGLLGVAEGIETALAATQATGVPTAATYCAGNLAAWQWPLGVRALAIFADNDDAGREAAKALQARALRAGLRCEVLLPAEVGADWLDCWSQRGAVEITGGPSCA